MSGFLGWARAGGAPVEEQSVRHALSGTSESAGLSGAVWTGSSVGLGTAPFSPWLEAPELQRHRSGTAVVGNVRLDDPSRLAGKIGEGTSRKEALEESPSDTELVLAAYLKWGPSCTEHLRGAFAFTVWDPASRRLVAARDPFGREPLFFHEGPEAVAVASELNPLRRLPSVTERLDERRVADFLMFMHEDRRATFYADIRRLPPGHLLIASPDGMKVRQYRVLSPSEEASRRSDEEHEKAYREHFFRAVRRSMRGSGRLGTWLSGGLDSSAVTCAARKLHPDSKALPTFSLTFDSVPESDERAFMEAVHREGDYDPHFVSGDEQGPLDIADEAMEALGEPFMTPNLFMTTSLLEAARSAGVDTALDGFLGDSVTGHGTRRVAELVVKGRWLAAARELRGAAQHLGPSRATYRNLLRQFVFGPIVLGPIRRAWKDLMGHPAGDDMARSVVRPELLRRTDWDARARAFGADRDRTPLTERKAHESEVTSGNLGLAVETAVRTGRRFGVSLRFPFADEDLISLCLALPPRQKCRNGWTRHVARKSLSDVLPEKITDRYGKASLGPVFKRALLDLNGERLEAIVHDQLEEAGAFLRPDAVRQLYRRSVDGEASQDGIAILWNAVLLARWMNVRETADKASAAPSASPAYAQTA